MVYSEMTIGESHTVEQMEIHTLLYHWLTYEHRTFVSTLDPQSFLHARLRIDHS